MKAATHPPETISKPFTLLLVDDDPRVLDSLRRVLRLAVDCRIITSANGVEALDRLSRQPADAAIVDLKMPEMDGMTLLQHLHQDYPTLPVIMLTGHGGVSEAVAAMQCGATDFLEKPYAPESLAARINQLRQIWVLQRENERLRQEARFRFGYHALIGVSRPMLAIKTTVAQIGPSDASVLIQGETGTGKELVARAIHHHSPRADKAFIPVDCAAISETVIESELFGHVKGAFTGAYETTLGLVRAADQGTLFLDEVGELTPAIQAKLLRTIQQREVRPVGGNKTYAVNLRIVAATNRDLQRAVAEGTFREDLFYRLNVIRLQVPPLRERDDDVLLLARHFIEHYSSSTTPASTIGQAAATLLERYDWPGNVRQLENTIHRAMTLCQDTRILPQDLPPEITGDANHVGSHALPENDTLAAFEKTGHRKRPHQKRR
ncbi:sigma-54-dependent transcriptional regulator [Desulfosarcina cetonica]|uniref:sigma-54-dependent transcriptional regulator n=1 Tax=Desulfosarcina cetonica TaxID=90730 RepID=UPI0006D01876|nr:sigma-54 dependent transcriptional regulator [Desulfosarcina cetonica]